MDFILFELSDRKILQGDDGFHFDSKIMTQRGQDFEAKKDEIESNPDNTITLFAGGQ